MKMKKIEIEHFRKFLISKNFEIFIENCMKMKNFEIEIFRNFSRVHLWMDADHRPINIFLMIFFQSALDFQGGHAEHGFAMYTCI